jgi:hypothetical protein
LVAARITDRAELVNLPKVRQGSSTFEVLLVLVFIRLDIMHVVLFSLSQLELANGLLLGEITATRMTQAIMAMESTTGLAKTRRQLLVHQDIFTTMGLLALATMSLLQEADIGEPGLTLREHITE